MFADQRRALRLFARPGRGGFWLAWLLDRSSDWIVLNVLLVATWNWQFGWTVVPWVLAAWLAPRFVFLALDGRTRWISWPISNVVRALLLAFLVGLAATDVVRPFVLLVVSAAVLGTAAALGSQARQGTLAAQIPLRDLGAAASAAGFLDRVAVVLGGLIAWVLLLFVAPGIVWLVAAARYLVAAVLSGSSRRSRTSLREDVSTEGTNDPATATELVARLSPRIAMYVALAFTSGAVAATLLLGSVGITSRAIDEALRVAESLGPLLMAATGIGLALGPLPVPRLLLRVSPPLLALALTLIVAIAMAALVLTGLVGSRPTFSVVLAIVAFLVIGLTTSTLDSLRAIALRRLAPGPSFGRAMRISGAALLSGQLYGVISVAVISPLGALAIAAALAVAQVILVALAVLLGGRGSLEIGGLSALPVKSVVHKLSWDTRPPAEPSNFSQSSPRVQALARWINRRAAAEKLRVRLPESGREYAIYRPTDDARETLFGQGRADPEKQMPYWAKVWPSGVALADVVAERKEEVASKHVLELGAGLGVTACAVLEHGGRLVTADYSSLPLAYCRLNALVNTDGAPNATCFNWRHDSEVSDALSQPQFRDGFPLLIAGDVLYEGRDAEPLLNVIERMLVDDGSLWLAEPVRRTAQRFLDSAAELGWEISSRQVTADWPDATNGPVNLHFLKRSAEPGTIGGDLGGWRI